MSEEELKKKHNPDCKICGRELTTYFSEDFTGSNEGTCGYKCDYCDGKKQGKKIMLEEVEELIDGLEFTNAIRMNSNLGANTTQDRIKEELKAKLQDKRK